MGYFLKTRRELYLYQIVLRCKSFVCQSKKYNIWLIWLLFLLDMFSEV